jgi:signal transduction histidine kinase
VSLATDSRHVRVEIADTGCGIPEEELPHIFDRFHRLDKSRPANARHAGLGLAIAKRILELHQGSIWARSRSGEGAVFGFEMAVWRMS